MMMKGSDFLSDPCYGPAMLKVAFDLKGSGNYKGFDRIFEESLSWLDIPRDRFENYIGRFRRELEDRCRMIGA